jgi:hypothetical protein
MEEFRARRTLFEKESVFTVESGLLLRKVEGVEAQRIALGEVRKVGLVYQPLTMGDRWVCSVEAQGGRIWIPSASFTGVGRTEDRRASFRAFVVGLNQAMAAEPAAARIAFIQGSHWAAWSALALLICLGVMGVLLLLAVAGSLMGGGGAGGWNGLILPMIVTVWAGSIVWRIWRRNHQHAYDPMSVPADFAPPR